MGHDKGNTKAKTSTKASLNAPRESAIKKDGEYFHLHFSLFHKAYIFDLLCFCACQSASTILDEKQKDGLGSTNDGFYESRRDWLGRCHIILAFERYYFIVFLFIPIELAL